MCKDNLMGKTSKSVKEKESKTMTGGAAIFSTFITRDTDDALYKIQVTKFNEEVTKLNTDINGDTKSLVAAITAYNSYADFATVKAAIDVALTELDSTAAPAAATSAATAATSAATAATAATAVVPTDTAAKTAAYAAKIAADAAVEEAKKADSKQLAFHYLSAVYYAYQAKYYHANAVYNMLKT